MVRRKLNIPVAKVGKFPLFWLQEMQKSKWNCSRCEKQQDTSTQKHESLAFEVLVRKAVKNAEKEYDPIKVYFCLDCAEDVLEEAISMVKTGKTSGVNGIRMMREL